MTDISKIHRKLQAMELDSGEVAIAGAAAEVVQQWNLDQDLARAALLVPFSNAKEAQGLIGRSERKLAARTAELHRYIDTVSVKPKHSATGENIQKLLLKQAGDDLRPLLLILAYVVADLERPNRTKEQRQRVARQGLMFLGPLAERLNMHQAKVVIENTSFQILQPDRYAFIEKILHQTHKNRERDMLQLKRELLDVLHDHELEPVEIQGRTKHVYGVYQKLAKSGDTSKIYDLIGVRVIANDEADCYASLDAIHDYWEPMPGRFKDYIARPKPNGYQSLHSTVLAIDGKPAEIQIRSAAMHDFAEHGAAAHFLYGAAKSSKGYLKRQSSPVLKRQEKEEIYVFSPNGDLFALSAGAVALDFAFAVHSGIGMRTQGAKLNDAIAKLDSSLRDGDRISVITAAKAQPNRGWLDIVQTSKAKNRIRIWLRAAEKDQNKETGLQKLQASAERLGVNLPSDLAQLARDFNFAHADDLLAAVGANVFSAERVVHALQPKAEKKSQSQSQKTNYSGKVLVGGMYGLQYRLAPCCNPEPPQQIKGYITRSLGISVHRSGCNHIKQAEVERIVDCTWE